METQSDSASLSEDRSRRFTSKDTSFSLRSPPTKSCMEVEQSSSQRGRNGNRQRGNRRSRPDDRKPTLAQFAPDLVSRFQSSPQEEAPSRRSSARARDIANRCRRGQSEPKDSFSLRSPLDRKSESQTKSRGSGGKRHRGHQRQTTSWQSSQTLLEDIHPTEKDAAQQDSTIDSRARKCLWADEVDEAFVDGDNLDEAFDDGIELDQEEADSSGDTESPRPPLTEQQMARREKDIAYGKATQGYLNYLQQVPRHQRDKKCPRTPDKTATNYSRRKWDSLVHKWRRNLHQWDDPLESCADDDVTSEEGTPMKGILRDTDIDGENRTPSPRKRPLLSSTRSSPSDLGYVTTPDSKANLSWQQLDDDIDSLPPEHDDEQHFPPLTSAVSNSPAPLPTKGAWTLRRTGSEIRAEAESDSLNDFAQKLTISGDVEGAEHMQE